MSEDLRLIIGKNILSLRLESKMTQQTFGLTFNYSDKAVSKWERGEALPDISVLKQIADYFGVSVDYLLGRQEIDDSTLSDYERQLLMASRMADERAKQDALNMLLSHAVSTKSNKD